MGEHYDATGQNIESVSLLKSAKEEPEGEYDSMQNYDKQSYGRLKAVSRVREEWICCDHARYTTPDNSAEILTKDTSKSLGKFFPGSDSSKRAARRAVVAAEAKKANGKADIGQPDAKKPKLAS